jgi:beta-phosphoglucomutase-like phosphatase (HAD superfamily)
MRADPSSCVVVGDTTIGALVAIAAGMRVVGYIADANPEPMAALGIGMIDSLTELPALIIGGR